MISTSRIRRPVLWMLVLLALVMAAALYAVLTGPASVRIASFNIQDYPHSPEQAAGAVDFINDLDVDAVGIQEVTEPKAFDNNVDAYLDDRWQTVHVDQDDAIHRVALLYDNSALEFLEHTTHRDTVVVDGARATLEVRLKTRSGDARRLLRIFVVHLAAHPDGTEQRRQQLHALRPIIGDAVDSDDEVAIVGDFNAIGVADHHEIEEFAGDTGLDWTSQHLRCTAYWERDDICRGTPLDHILSTEFADSVQAAGACQTVGCAPREECPRYVDQISDHCPVVAEF